jgi:hypothetical protein
MEYFPLSLSGASIFLQGSTSLFNLQKPPVSVGLGFKSARYILAGNNPCRFSGEAFAGTSGVIGGWGVLKVI